MKPAISIITPAFNAEKFLLETIQSVRSQTEVDYEHIIVVDGSTDRTMEIAQMEALHDPRILVISLKKNAGPAAARNAGLTAARGTFICFLDADDYWEPDFIHSQKTALERAGSHAIGIFCHSRNFNDVTGQSISLHRPRTGQYNLFRFLLNRCPPGNGSALMIKRSAFIAAGHFDTSLERGEDTEMWLRLIRANPESFFLCNGAILVHRRLHDSARTTGKNFMIDSEISGFDRILGIYLPALTPGQQAHVLTVYSLIFLRLPSSRAQEMSAIWAKQAQRTGQLWFRDHFLLLVARPVVQALGPTMFSLLKQYRRLMTKFGLLICNPAADRF